MKKVNGGHMLANTFHMVIINDTIYILKGLKICWPFYLVHTLLHSKTVVWSGHLYSM